MTRDDLVPRGNYNFALPSGSELANPTGMDEFRAMAEEIGRSSTEMVMKDLRERGIEMGVLPDNMTPGEALAAAEGITKLPDGFRVSIMVSRSMGEGALRDLMGRHRLRKDVRFVFRGVPAEMSVPEFAFWLKELMDPDGAGLDDLNITLDPNLYDHAGAELAPTMILEDLNSQHEGAAGMDLGKIVARAVGFSDPDWLYAQSQRGRDDESSTNAVAIEEEDLRVRAEREATQVAAGFTRDPEVLKHRYWDRTAHDLRMMRILPAAESRRRVLHFMFQTQEAIRDNEGNIIAHPGEVFQPKDVLPFDRRIFVFNPNLKEEVEFVEAEMKKLRAGVSKIMLLVTEIPVTQPGAEPWDGLQAVIDRFGVHVFVLNDHFRNSFKVELTPTEIYPEEVNGSVEVISQEYALQ